MSIKKSVRLTAPTIEHCNVLSEGGVINWSGSLNAMAEQFGLLLADNTPALSPREWNVFYCLQNGYMPHPSAKTEADLLPWHVSEGYQYDTQVSEFIGTPQDAVEFIERVRNWTTSQRLAVIYRARKFWRDSQLLDDPHEQAGTEQ